MARDRGRRRRADPVRRAGVRGHTGGPGAHEVVAIVSPPPYYAAGLVVALGALLALARPKRGGPGAESVRAIPAD